MSMSVAHFLIFSLDNKFKSIYTGFGFFAYPLRAESHGLFR